MGRVLETSQHLGDGPCGNIVIVMLFLTANYVLFYAKYVYFRIKMYSVEFFVVGDFKCYVAIFYLKISRKMRRFPII